ncbi:hypothetical protein [Okeania sp. SIO2B3]|uniref:hypothetical protein n=1 Tax=Okeania sp. SIO2B3 TaxID=2607784 RepID=UPI0013C1EA54|nr:hypothetical protein [Okeania sp. SIO2B3]NET43628.1 hypothetical protein [Okeania sp. SIO2B3]
MGMEELKQELEQSHAEFYQLLMELEQSHAQLEQMQMEFEESELLRKKMEIDLEQMKYHLEHTQGELAQTKSALHQTEGELDRYKYREAIASQIISEKEKEYKQLVWDAWSAYRSGNINQMVDCLQRSLKCTSLSRTKTVSNWVKSWREFSQQKGERFEVRRLDGYQEWKQLLRRMTVVKSGGNISPA